MPSYETNDPRGWGGDPRRGAAMGRREIKGIPEGKFVLRRVPINSGGYDPLGTYWGIGEPLYWYADEGENVEGCIRAKDREDAKVKVRARYPDAKFYR